MAYKYFIYSTGTTFAGTVVRQSATDNPGVNEASHYADFMIPEIQPDYLWRVDAIPPTQNDLIPNTDANIAAYIDYLAPAPSPTDVVTYGQLTGITETKIDTVTGATNEIPIFTADGNLVSSGYLISDLTGGTTGNTVSWDTFTGYTANTEIRLEGIENDIDYISGITDTKIDKVTGATDNIAIFTSGGNLQDSGYTIPELTGLTTYTFIESGGTQIFQNGNQITIYSTVPTGTTVTWGNITGTLNAQTDLWSALQNISGATTGNTAQIQENFALFTGFTATTEQDFIDVYDYIDYVSGVTDTKLNISTFTGYTATTQPILDAALTGLTNLGTGTTLGGTSGRNVTLKSISVTGNLELLGDGDNIIISGGSGISSVNWGDIGGTLSGQTDLWNELTGLSAQIDTKLDIVAFTGYSATTDQRLQGIEADIQYISGVTSGLTAEIDTKLDIVVFTGYTATTQPILDAALTGATNGLTAVGRDVELGGTLTKDTVISGLTYDLTVNVDNITLQSVGAINIVDANGVGGVNISSEGGTISIIGKDALGTGKTKIEISDTQMLVTDDRAVKVGLQYAADYSTTFTDESLITKRYADAIAGGLIPKAAVKVATTGAITLSGLSTVDGIALSNGDRVLVKNQASAETNGIYIASASTWTRATDYDGTPTGEVSSGNIIPVLTGDTNHNSLWVLVTPNPITIDVTPLSFTLYASPHYSAGHGIGITGSTIYVNGSVLAGSSILWSGGTFNVDPTTGTLASALAEKLDVTTFTGYTAATSQLIGTKLDTTVFTGYTATTQPILDGAITGATNGLTAFGRNIGLGGDLTGSTTIDGLNIHDLFIANINEFQVATDGLTGATFGVDTTGIMLDFSGTTVELTSNAGLEYGADYSANYTPRSLVDADFVTGLTSGLQADIDYISGVTDTNYWAFTGYTASTKNKDKRIQLVSSASTDINTVAVTPILWATSTLYDRTGAVITGTSDTYQWTGGSSIRILQTGKYEVSYQITVANGAGATPRSVGSYLILNNASTIQLSAAGATVTTATASEALTLPTVILDFNANDKIDLVGFRVTNSGSVNLVPYSVFLVLNRLS